MKNIHNDKGLTSIQVKERISKGLENGNYSVPTKSILQIIRNNICTLFNLLNFALAFWVLLVHSYKNMLFMGVIFCNVVIGIVQEIRAKKVMDRLAVVAAPKAKVLRDGKTQEIVLEHLVLDDLCILKRGDQICADSQIVSGECEVDESLLTGEIDPIFKSKGDSLLSGSFVVSGEVEAQVIHVGADNYAYKIVRDAKQYKKTKSEMLSSINTIIRIVAICIVPFAAILFLKQYSMTEQVMDRAVVGTVAAVVAMIPEGLVLLMSVVLSVSVIRLSKKNTLVQDLYCIETLARVDVLCLDKTGTITEGKMQLDNVILFPVSGFTTEQRQARVGDVLCAMMQTLSDDNPTYYAVKERFCEPSHWKAEFTLPFSSEKKWSLASFRNKGTYVLGAAEFILGREADSYQKHLNAYAKDGYRVLLLAASDEVLTKRKYTKTKKLPKKIDPLAFLLLSDKIRPEAEETFKYFAKEGVELKIISGDHPITVAGIAKRTGLKGSDSFVDATTLITDEELALAASKYTVFGRVTPYQKLGLIKALKEQGHTVGMTGDGVNDVLALREADCSVAMQAGSDAARNVSKLVLLDSNFASMPQIVAEGRRAINNLERSAALFLEKTVYAFLLATIFLFINLPYPFAPIQLTLISGLTIGIPSFLLALEPNIKRVEGHFLKNVMRTAIPGGLLIVANILFVLIMGYVRNTPIEQTSTVATFVTAIVSFFVMFKISQPWNLYRASIFFGLIGAFLIAVFFIPNLFNIVKLNVSILLVLLGQGVASALLLGPLSAFIAKLFIDRKKKA